uniref:NADH-ubiquinone oxidoreductase chain 2 n=1 Tax=Gigantidas platifrons TaxID=2830794 RepID=A0A1B4WR88_9BIVA|nr:NADH dehydrogenase subunit 2 [Gigantidas platifrons]ASB29952.1 NADH dehydrogenase subunit 2 [Gigantidas platifrons]ASB29960.1 NADH dehydrogenase subunit 2 [Gigantidas platifrons]BAV25055.1 NADH dehydrogenase subunit 2 [Gigantidas platifrons]
MSRFEGPLSVLGGFTLISGLIMMISTDSHIASWVGMEVNMLGFMCLLSVKSVLNMRVLINYFVFQSFGSTMYLFGSSVILHCESFNIALLGYFLIHLGLLCKAGLFPFWVWVPSVVNSSGWFVSYLLLGIQKVGPLLLLGVWSPCSEFLYFVIFAMSVLGGLGGSIQNSYRDVLVYSSFVHSAWMLVCLIESQNLLLFYIGAYLVQLGLVIYYLWRSNASSVKSGKWSLMVASCLMSLSGLPPLAGFVVKMTVVFCVGDKLILLFTLAGSITAMFYYLKAANSSIVKDYGLCLLNDGGILWVFLSFTFGLYAWIYLLGCLLL